MKTVKIHVAAALLAMLSILCFLAMAIGAELFPQSMATLRKAIAWGLLLLVPALVTTAVTGHRLARGQRGRIVGDKLLRMQWMAANGILVLAPSALWLAWRAAAGEVHGLFGVVQMVEIAAGATNLCLLLHNLRDGLRLSGRWSRNFSPSLRVIRRA